MNTRSFLSFSLLAALALGTPVASFAAPKKPDAEKPAAKPEETSRPIPYHGKVTAVDAAAKTFSLKGAQKDRVFSVTDSTTIIGKDGAPAKLDAIPVGEEVRGSAMKDGEKWTALKVTIGAKDAATPKPKDATATPKPKTKPAAALPTPAAPVPAPGIAPKADEQEKK